MKNLSLIKPSKTYYQSYLNLVAEFNDNQEKLIPFPLSYQNDDVDKLLLRFENDSLGIIQDVFVPNSTFWLVLDNAEVVAVSNLRHRLNDKLLIEGGHIGYGVKPSMRSRGFGKEILRLTLNEAKKINISKVLITCNKNNIASQKVILANGGIFKSEDYVEEYGGIVKRYWIDI